MPHIFNPWTLPGGDYDIDYMRFYKLKDDKTTVEMDSFGLDIRYEGDRVSAALLIVDYIHKNHILSDLSNNVIGAKHYYGIFLLTQTNSGINIEIREEFNVQQKDNPDTLNIAQDMLSEIQRLIKLKTFW